MTETYDLFQQGKAAKSVVAAAVLDEVERLLGLR